jgi:hypothetical protein
MPRNQELEEFRRPVKVEVTNPVTQVEVTNSVTQVEVTNPVTLAKPTLHPDAIIPVSNYVMHETTGALNVAVPSGAIGVMMQVHNDVNNRTYDDVCYWMFNTTNVPMTTTDQGFILSGDCPFCVFWFDTAVITYFNFWLGSNDVELYYRFVKRSTL